jgi:hypothetical protein
MKSTLGDSRRLLGLMAIMIYNLLMPKKIETLQGMESSASSKVKLKNYTTFKGFPLACSFLSRK